MELKNAIYYAKEIIKMHPQYLLCGSTALIIGGKIPSRDVHDLDFCCGISHIHEVKPLRFLRDDGYHIHHYDGYDTYKIDVDGPYNYYYNVFVHKDPKYLYAQIVNGIQCQSLDQILFWKKSFGRSKDKKDMGV